MNNYLLRHKNVELLISASLLLLAGGQFTRLSLPLADQSVGIYLADIVLAMIWGIWIIGVATSRFTVRFPLFVKLLLLFVAVAALSQVASLRMFSMGEIIPGVLYLVRFILYLGLLVVPISITFSKERLSDAIVLSGVMVAVIGFWQLVFVPDFTFMARFGWDPHYGRLLSAFFDPNFTGGFLLVIFLLTLALLLRQKNNQIAYFLAGAIVYLALALTYSRSSYLGFSVAVLLFALLARSKRLIAFGLLLVGLLFLIQMPRGELETKFGIDRSASAQARLSSWEQGWIIAQENPLLGVGFNNYRVAQFKYGFLDQNEWDKHSASGNDSSLLSVLSTSGVVGFSVFVGGFLMMLKSLFSKGQLLSRAVGCAVVGLVVHGQFVNSLFYPPIMAVVWLMVALCHKD